MRMRNALKVSAALSLALTGVWMETAEAADHLNLEEGLPTEVEDAYPLPHKGREFQGILRYERDGDQDQILLEPRIEYGVAPNTQVRLAVPFSFGDGEVNTIEDVGVELFYNFNAESLSTPAFAVSIGANLPTGPDSEGVDPNVRFLATKTIGNEKLERLHLNLGYTRNFGADSDEREHLFTGILGYSRRLNSDTILVSDFIFELEDEARREAYILELGIRHQINPQMVFTVGAGAGLTPESPDVRLTVGVQRSF